MTGPVRSAGRARTTVALVGNAPLDADQGRAIDACDRVVRFNDARGFGEVAGSRVDELFLVNRGGAPAEWLEDPALGTRPAIRAARRILLPLHPGSAFLGTRRDAAGAVHRDDVDHTRALRARLAGPAREVVALDARHHERCCRALGLVPAPATGTDSAGDGAAPPPDAAVHRPSTGFVALLWYLTTLPPEARIRLHGFTFEGWSGHPWARERERVAAEVRAGRVELVAPDAAAVRPATPREGFAGGTAVDGKAGRRAAAVRAADPA